MRTAAKKLRASSGETLAESLCAILLVTLAALMLVVSLRAAASINYQVREADNAFRAELAAAEVGAGATAVDGTITIKSYSSPVTKAELEADPPPAEIPEEEDAAVKSYALSGKANALHSYAAPEAEGGET